MNPKAQQALSRYSAPLIVRGNPYRYPARYVVKCLAITVASREARETECEGNSLRRRCLRFSLVLQRHLLNVDATDAMFARRAGRLEDGVSAMKLLLGAASIRHRPDTRPPGPDKVQKSA